LRSGDLHDRVPPEGRYANFFKVGHNAYEIVIEFGQLYKTERTPRIHGRVITSPAYARELLATLQQALHEYQEEYRLRETEI
jgi:hypothetical protein